MRSRSGDMVIRVFGMPRPWPKKMGGGKHKGIRNDDFRTRRNKFTGKKEFWDKGYKMKWFNHVRSICLEWMDDNGRKPFTERHPIGIGMLTFIPKTKSSKLKFCTSIPDMDNLEYGVPNVLKRTVAVKAGLIEGAYPEGVAFYEDSQMIWRAYPDGVLWATEANPPGMLITILDMLDHLDILEAARKVDADVVSNCNEMKTQEDYF